MSGRESEARISHHGEEGEDHAEDRRPRRQSTQKRPIFQEEEDEEESDLSDEEADDADFSPQPRRKKPSKRKKAMPEEEEEEEGDDETLRQPPPSRKKNKKKKPTKQPLPPAPKRINFQGKPARYSAKASKKVLERIERTMPGSGHRLFLIDRKTNNSNAPKEEFIVLGATGNVYTVTISTSPHCSCPDAAKGNVCKHHLFVMLRVLRRAVDDPLIWQRGLLPEEVSEILSSPGTAGEGDDDLAGVRANAGVVQRYRQLQEEEEEGKEEEKAKGAPRRALGVEDECPICQDVMVATATAASERVCHCFTCGNAAHTECISLWVKARRGQGLAVTCPFCRGVFEDPTTTTTGAGARGGGGGERRFLNLGEGSAPSVEDLYGDRAVWLRAQAGEISRGAAVRQWNERNR